MLLPSTMKPRILVPFDFSDSATRALAWAADLQATSKSDAPIHLIHVISSFPTGDPITAIDMLVPGPDEIATVKSELAEAGAKAGARVTTEVITRPTRVGETVVEVAEAIHADLIAMGTHGRSGVKRLMLGSQAEHVVRHASCPVVTMRAHNA
jgi:nucleotide-binding universal stress UspA family protein